MFIHKHHHATSVPGRIGVAPVATTIPGGTLTLASFATAHPHTKQTASNVAMHTAPPMPIRIAFGANPL